MMQLNSPILQKSTEKMRSGYGKATFHKIAKQNDFVCTFVRAVLPLCRTPLDDGATLKNLVVYQLGDFGFSKLAFLPPLGEIGDYFDLSFTLGVLGSHH